MIVASSIFLTFSPLFTSMTFDIAFLFTRLVQFQKKSVRLWFYADLNYINYNIPLEYSQLLLLSSVPLEYSQHLLLSSAPLELAQLLLLSSVPLEQ